MIDAVIAAVAKKLGRDAIVRLSDPAAYEPVRYAVSTALPSLDNAIGVGGIPLGKLTQVSGPPSSGKTTLSKWIAVQAQRQGVMPFFVDTEKSGAATFDAGMGIDLDRAIIARPDIPTLEDVFEHIFVTIDAAKRSSSKMLVIFDSVAATPSKALLDAEPDDALGYDPKARFLSRFLPKLVNMLTPEIGLFFVNQVRQKMNAQPWQDPWVEPGGVALEHWSHVRLRTTAAGWIYQTHEGERRTIGMRFRAKVRKNKLAPPNREAELEIYFDPPRVVDTVAERPPRRAVTEIPGR